MLCRAIRTATHWCGSRRGRPLHALACTRRLRTVAKPFTQFQQMPWHARAPLQLNKWNRGARGRRDFRNTGPRAAARPEPLAVPRHIGAPEAGRARCGSPPSLAPLGARARPVCHEYAGADSLGRARCSPATGSDRIASQRRCPKIAFCHALLHAWSPRCALSRLQPAASFSERPVAHTCVCYPPSTSKWYDRANFPRLQQVSGNSGAVLARHCSACVRTRTCSTRRFQPAHALCLGHTAARCPVRSSTRLSAASSAARRQGCRCSCRLAPSRAARRRLH